MDCGRRNLAAALRDRLAIIAEQDSRGNVEQHVIRLRDISERIERLAGELSLPVDPQLTHFLQRASYDKALALLESAPPQ